MMTDAIQGPKWQSQETVDENLQNCEPQYIFPLTLMISEIL